MVRKREQGISVVGFLIVSAVLAVLLVGGIYTVRKTGWFNMTIGNSAQAPKTGPSHSHSAPNTAGKTSQGGSQSQTTASNTSSNPVSSDTSPPQASDNTSQNGSQTGAGSSNANLPTTGPDDVASQLIGLGFIVAAVGAYIVSRRDVAVRSSL